MTQYSKRVVIVHWLTVLLVILAWYLGDNLAEATDNSKATLAGYVLHILVGSGIFLLTLSQLYFRRKDGRPSSLPDKPMYKRVAKFVHYLLYVVLIVLPMSGVTIILTSKVGRALLAGDANLLPKENGFKDVFAQVVHEQLVNVLIVLVVLHILGAIKHHFVMKDGLMRRMSLPKKD